MTQPSPIRLDTNYLLLAGRAAEPLPGGDTLFARLQTEASLADHVSSGWLVGEYPADDTWDYWEMHPNGDEIVHLTSGTVDIHVETDTATTVRLALGDTIVIPAGTWHSITVHQPARLLNITWGQDTQHRSR